jgi:hypothetical protein
MACITQKEYFLNACNILFNPFSETVKACAERRRRESGRNVVMGTSLRTVKSQSVASYLLLHLLYCLY